MPGRAKGVNRKQERVGGGGRERGNERKKKEKKRREKRTEGPRGAEIPQVPQELSGPGWLSRLGVGEWGHLGILL